MKIYPSNHSIQSVDIPSAQDIPIVQIEKEITPESIEIQIDENFAIDQTHTFSPYDSFDTNNFLVFDESNNRINNISFQKGNGNYVYEPSDATEFIPSDFSVSALVKKKQSYNSKKQYDLKIGVNDISNDLSWCKQMISIFGDAPNRGLCPANISVNGSSTQPASLINSTYKDLDFLFIETYDGIFMDNTKKTKLDMPTILSSHTNIWLSIEDATASGIFTVEKAAYDFSFKDKTIYDKTFTIPADYGFSLNIANVNKTFSGYTLDSLNDGNIKSPIAVIERPDCGFVIISHKNIFNNISQDIAKFIYEIMMRIYLKRYLQTTSISSWITDNPIDYINNLNMPFGKKHKDININNLLSGLNIASDECTIVNTIINSTIPICFTKTDNNGNMLFEKLTTTDPVKSNDEISIYTTEHTIIQYKKTVIKSIELKPVITSQIDDSISPAVCKITVGSVVSSSNNIYFTGHKTFILKNPDRKYYIIATPITNMSDLDVESYVMCVDEYSYDKNTQLAIAIVKVRFTSNEIAHDIRQLGGGLPLGADNDYDMLDIGLLKGRPYRVGTTMVIKLPAKYKPYDSIIKNAINMNKVAADVAILVYEEPDATKK